MVSWPVLGTRVSVRYRRPAGSVPPLTDAIGHLLDVTPLVRVRTKTGDVVYFASEDVVALRVLSDTPVRNSEIRALEHAAVLAWPGEQAWLDGWLVRAGEGMNYAVPLDRFASQSAVPSIVDWYRQRGLTPRLLIPERLLQLSYVGEDAHQVLVRDVGTPDTAPLADGATVSDAPDGTRWLGLSQPPSEALLAWGAHSGATRAFVRVADDDVAGATRARSLGFVLHHRGHYVTPAP